MRYAVPRLFAALFLAGVGVVPVAGQADASVCSSSTGVTVVVDFHELGGGVQTVCDPDGGGKTAARLFPDNGFPLDYVQRTPGFVCRVSGKPADDPCVNTPPSDAYWGLFWSNGTNGQWSYATAGAGGQKIPDGGSVAFSWQGSSTRSQPGVAPPEHSSQPTSPTSSPTGKPSSGGGGGGSGGTRGSGTSGPTSGSATAAAMGAPTAPGRHGRKAGDQTKPGGRKHSHGPVPRSDSPSAESSATAAGDAAITPVPDPPHQDDSGGLPGWVPISAIALLFATAVGVGVAQRRRS